MYEVMAKIRKLKNRNLITREESIDIVCEILTSKLLVLMAQIVRSSRS